MDIIVGGPLKPNGQNVPTRVGELINSISEIRSIPNPRVGMEVWVQDENRGVRVLSLKENTISGVVVPNAMVDKWEYIDARLQGTSEESDPMADPFVKLFAGNSDALAEVLDSTIESGRYRIVYGGFMHIDMNVWARSNGNIVQTIEGFIKNYEGGIDVSEERNCYVRTGINSNGVVAWKEWEVISGSSIKKMLDANINAVDEEIIRATESEAELLARLQGTSEESDPMADPFVKLFAGNSDALAEVLDSTIESGRYRIVYGGFMHIDMNVWARSNGNIVQTIEGFIKNYEGGIDVSEERNCYTRERVNNVWGKWHPGKSLAGKSIAFFGGSQCHLAVDRGSITQYTDTNKTDTIKENVGYIREQLEYYGANIVSYAVQGTGFLRPIDGKTIFSQASNAGVHDIYVIWASTNDWVMGAYPLGEFDDYQKDGKVETVCGALNATISALIDKNKNAKIYVLLPMKGVDTRGFDFANGKYGNAMSDIISTYYKNPMGYTFGDYINAVVKVCAFRGVAVADTFSTANLSLAQIINSAITGLYWNEGLLVGGSDVYVGYYIHPRRAGYKAVWEVIKRTLIDEYGEHIVQQAAIYSEQERAKKAENTLAEQIAAILKRIAALEGLHVAIEATVADNNLTLSGDGVELETGEAVESYSLALPEDKVTLEDENLIIN